MPIPGFAGFGPENVPKNIYKMLAAGSGANVLPTDYAKNLGVHYIRGATENSQTKERSSGTLYMSEIGTPCIRKLWYKINKPDTAEASNDSTMRLKFMYGDMLEELVLQLAADAGHAVTHRQEPMSFHVNGWEVRGKIDAVIDNVIVDVKSVTKYSEQKFTDGLKDDPFGYNFQLYGYKFASKGMGFGLDPGFLTIQKELGHVKYFPYSKMAWQQSDTSFMKTLGDITSKLEEPSTLTLPRLGGVKMPNGNETLCTTCSYCEFKKQCWVGMRVFKYSTGPVYMIKVVKTPNVPEITNV